MIVPLISLKTCLVFAPWILCH